MFKKNNNGKSEELYINIILFPKYFSNVIREIFVTIYNGRSLYIFMVFKKKTNFAYFKVKILNLGNNSIL